ncbi:MAG: GNAT family N-acetyltransferase, partial [Lysobacter sp.]
PVLIELCREHAVFERARIGPGDEPARTQRLRDALSGPSPRLQAWLALESGAVLGYAAASLEFSTWAAREFVHLDCLYLREAARNRGLGRRLLAQVLAFARRRGCAQVQWQTPRWNRGAIGFYRREGAVLRNKARFTYETGAASRF